MKSAQRGSDTLPVEVTDVSRHGIWMLIKEKEVFLSYEHFPWFQDASIKKILHAVMPSEHHLYWPDLDVDLEIESIISPEKYPLISRYPGETRDEQ